MWSDIGWHTSLVPSAIFPTCGHVYFSLLWIHVHHSHILDLHVFVCWSWIPSVMCVGESDYGDKTCDGSTVHELARTGMSRQCWVGHTCPIPTSTWHWCGPIHVAIHRPKTSTTFNGVVFVRSGILEWCSQQYNLDLRCPYAWLIDHASDICVQIWLTSVQIFSCVLTMAMCGTCHKHFDSSHIASHRLCYLVVVM